MFIKFNINKLPYFLIFDIINLMIRLFIFLFLAVLFIIMMGIMIIFERNNAKNLIVWTVLFIFTQPIGYVIYLLCRIVINKKRNSLTTKELEDEIYLNLSNKSLFNNEIDLKGELFEFNKLAFNASSTENNSYEMFNSYLDFKTDISKTIKKANKTILIQTTKLNPVDFEPLKELLKEKANNNIVVKLVYTKNISRKLIKELKASGVKCYRFSRYNMARNIYFNCKNIIVVDGVVAYLGSLNVSAKQLSGECDVCDCLLKIKGDMVQAISLELHNDIIYASGKYLDFSITENINIKNNNVMQYIVNKHEENMELLIIKAISSAKRSIQIQVDEFIPTSSLISLLNFAINSGIEVKLMVPLMSNKKCKFYATRAHAKELALLGAKVYLYDGFIRFNAINVDDEYIIYGGFTLDREYIGNSLQNILIIKDENAVNHFNSLFSSCINNSYKINNANFMLLREKFFKNFV